MMWNGRLGYILSRMFPVLLVITVIHLITQSKLTCTFENNFHYSANTSHPHNSSSSQLEASKLYSFDELTEISHGVVLNIEKIWKEELSQVSLQGKNRYVTEQTIETGGVPERIMLITTWRSGSSYVGKLLKSRPGTYYFFEPLHNSYINTVREESEIRGALEILRNLFHCRIDGRHTTDNLLYGSFFSRNSDLLAIAERNKLLRDHNFAASFCRRSPIMAMKVVGLRLRHTIPLLADEKLNLKVIYLIRDPQATINSRLKDEWCKELSHCGNLDIFCSDLVDDFNASRTLERDYPERFMVLQYEDLITRSRTSNKFLQFLNISTDASTALGSAMDASQLTKWIKDLGRNLELVLRIRGACAKAMDLWGYIPIGALPSNTSTPN